MHGTDTLLIPPGDAGALADAMMWALDEPDAAKSHSARLKDEVARKFTIATMTGAVLDFQSPAREPAELALKLTQI